MEVEMSPAMSVPERTPSSDTHEPQRPGEPDSVSGQPARMGEPQDENNAGKLMFLFLALFALLTLAFVTFTVTT